MAVVETDVPARLDRLPWARFHWLVVTGLGIAWVLDGLEVTLVGSLSGAIAQSPVLHMSAARVGASASAYLAGAVVGALGFGWLADRLGRKRLFAVTVLVYLTATLATGLAWSFASFALFRALTGAGIGGEYAAVNAAIQELIPARRRGFTDLVVNGSFWIGAAIGAGGSLVALDPRLIPPELGWRVAFGLGGVLGLRGAGAAALDPRKPALADDAWPAGGGGAGGARDRGPRGGRDRAAAAGAAEPVAAAHRRPLLVRRRDGGAGDTISPAHRAGGGADGEPGLLLQRGVFHLCPDPHAVLRRGGRAGGAVHPAFRGEQFFGPAAAGAAVRCGRAAGDDRRNLCRLRPADGADRRACSRMAGCRRWGRPPGGRARCARPCRAGFCALAWSRSPKASALFLMPVSTSNAAATTGRRINRKNKKLGY